MTPVRVELSLLEEAPAGKLKTTYVRGKCYDCWTKSGSPRVVAKGRRGTETAIADNATGKI